MCWSVRAYPNQRIKMSGPLLSNLLLTAFKLHGIFVSTWPNKPKSRGHEAFTLQMCCLAFSALVVESMTGLLKVLKIGDFLKKTIFFFKRKKSHSPSSNVTESGLSSTAAPLWIHIHKNRPGLSSNQVFSRLDYQPRAVGIEHRTLASWISKTHWNQKNDFVTADSRSDIAGH